MAAWRNCDPRCHCVMSVLQQQRPVAEGALPSYFYGIARGIDERQVKPNRVRKSVGAEDTFSQDLSYDPAREGLQPLIEQVWGYCEANESAPRR
jgi:nucleotidyltransferase/DNA polymerase involved in DNA repair